MTLSLRAVSIGLVSLCLLLAPGPGRAGLLELDGIDDRLTVPFSPTFPTENFTLMAWVRTALPATDVTVLARGEDGVSGHQSWQLHVTPTGQLGFRIDDAAGTRSCYPFDCSGVALPECTIGDLFVADDTMRHVTATRTLAGELALYVDGEPQATCTSSATPSANSTQSLTLGCTHETTDPPSGTASPTGFLAGRIESAAAWFIDLNADQVWRRYCRGVFLDEDGLVGLWEMNEDGGQSLTDLSTARNDAFLGADPDGAGDPADPLWIVGPPWGPGEATDLRVRLDRPSATLQLSFEPACDASQHVVHVGPLDAVSTYEYQFAECFVGPTSATLSASGPSFFFVVVGQRDDAEGSYGRDSSGIERPEATDTVGCDADQALNLACRCP
ncbi:MAG: LamG domain-containing protein [Acidobacteriota bacterium]